MRQLLCASNTGQDVSGDVLNSILSASPENNAKVGVTGILLYIAGGFMQVLEGEEQAVSETYARICKDQRHWNTTVILDRNAERSFGKWSMGFERLAPGSGNDGMFEITRDVIAGKVKPGAAAEIVVLLKTFYRVQSGE